MIYVETGSADVSYNLALEYYLAAEKQLGEPVFLFWPTVPTVVCGKYQNTLEEINLPYTRAHNIDVVRRLSGGGTIYTDEGGLMYTFITYGDGTEIDFRSYMQPVVSALAELGVTAEFSGRNDILVDGKKVSGTAQYKIGGTTVHHGTLMFNVSVEHMLLATQVDAEKIASKSIKSVRGRVTNISEHLPVPMDKEAFRLHMIRAISGDGATYELTSEDREAVERIADETFRPWEKRFGADPKCTLTHSRRYAGGKVTVGTELKHGHIQSVSFSGDFFASERLEALTRALCGCRFEPEAVLAVLSAEEHRGAIYNVTPEELTELFFGEASV
ncbi:MAG: lipoate--protein ligase [Oscillospiraceae bacterium]|nr:lipoate--protein ligase [Oscillospiraceae bacterium]MBR2896266.1 lipoate--protein ligase [Oscillospiraceae bacterium]MBR2976762.1 lipoate--protein ligase [Oscillospiraceae bacterium]MBR3850176.1 lipoate--protein ligase [Oscillospiraceae bacterium]